MASNVIILDDSAGSPGFIMTGPWTRSVGYGGEGNDVYYSNQPGATATWLFTGLAPGSLFDVGLTWTAGANRSTAIAWQVYDSDGTTVLGSGTVDQTKAPAPDYYDAASNTNFQRLVASAPISRTSASVRIWVPKSNYAIADAACLLPIAKPGSLAFTGPDSGVSGWPSAAFSVSLPAGTMPAAPFSVTPSDNGAGGTFAPPSVTLSSRSRSANFTYTPARKGAVGITIANSGGIPNPVALTFNARNSFSQALATFEAQMPGGYPGQYQGGHTYAPRLGPPAAEGGGDTDNHYDPLHAYWMARGYTGDASYDADIAAARYQERDLRMRGRGYGVELYHTMAEGLRMDAERTGDLATVGTSLMYGVIHPFVASGYTFRGDPTKPPGDPARPARWASSRELAFAMLAVMQAERLGAAHRPVLDQWAYDSTVILDYWQSDPTNAVDPYLAIQPFMAGITMQALIAYWDRYRAAPTSTQVPLTPDGVTQASVVAMIPGKIKAMLDYLRADGHGWVPGQLCWTYWDRDVTSMLNDKTPGIYPGSGMFDATTPTPAPALNSVIGHAYAWYALYSGDPKYLRWYEESFVGATAAGGADGSLQLYGQKEYNQAYSRGEMLGLAYRQRFLNSWPAATAYTLSAPAAASGRANQISAPFTLRLAGGKVAVSSLVVVTPSDGGSGGTFLPASAVLTTDEPLATFRYAPAPGSAGKAVRITSTNSGGLTDPPSVAYAVTTVAPIATGVVLSSPRTSNGPAETSPDFVARLDPPGSVPSRAADVDGGIVRLMLGTANCDTLPPRFYLSGEAPASPFQVRPASPAEGQVNFPAIFGLSMPPNARYTPAAVNTGLSYILTPPSPAYGLPGAASAPFGVSATAAIDGTMTITPSDGGQGGSFDPPSVSLYGAVRSAAFTYFPKPSWAIAITCCPNGTTTGAGGVTYTVAGQN